MMELVVIKRYNLASRAYLDSGLLSANGIESFVNGDSVVNSPLPGGEQVSLSVRESDRTAALSLLSSSNL